MTLPFHNRIVASVAAKFAAVAVWIASLMAFPGAAAQAFEPSDICPAVSDAYSGTLATSGAEYVICVPPVWLGDVALYAHGTVRVTKPGGKISTILDELNIEGLSQPEFFNLLGIVFGVAARSDTGWSKLGRAKNELIELRAIVRDRVGKIKGWVYLLGASQGGAIATKLVEQRPELFDGGLAACAPIGRLLKQITYWGNLLVVFDYFFPAFNILKDGLDEPRVPGAVRNNWEGVGGVKAQIRAALEAKPGRTRQIVDVVGVPTDPDGAVPIAESVLDPLQTAVFMTNDTITSLGGNPFKNTTRVYSGSNNDTKLNNGVKRYASDKVARDKLSNVYETTGDLPAPLVTIHTTEDPLVPYWHERLYRQKAEAAGGSVLLSQIRVADYGHCTFSPAEVAAAFGLLALAVEGANLLDIESVLSEPDWQSEYEALADKLGLN
jgi:pimeloyl-ACP methyl ester carboxylesterase